MIKYIARFYKSKSIKQKILLVFAVQIIIPMAFMGIMFYRNTQTTIQNKSVSYAIDLMKMIGFRMNDFYYNLITVTKDMIYDEKKYLGGEDSYSNGSLYEKQLRDYSYDALRRICLGNEYIQSIIVATTEEYKYRYDLNGGNVASEQMKDTKLLEDMLQQLRKSDNKPIWYTQLDDEGNLKSLYLLKMIYDSNNFKEKGLIIIQINRQKLVNIYKDLSKDFM